MSSSVLLLLKVECPALEPPQLLLEGRYLPHGDYLVIKQRGYEVGACEVSTATLQGAECLESPGRKCCTNNV